MKKKTLERILRVTVILTVVGILLFQFAGTNILVKPGIAKIPTLITAILLFWAFYMWVGWKLPLLKYLVYQENINGTWFGTYTSTDFTTNRKYQGEIAIVIRQSFLVLDVKSFTEKYINYSFGEVLSYDTKSDSNQLIYLYSQSQFNPADDLIRKGTSELMLHLNLNQKEFFGDFWTNHNSKGHLQLKKVTSKHCKSFLESKKSIK